MKKHKTWNIICSIIVLCLLIGGIIYMLTSLKNKAIAIIGSTIIGFLGLSVAIYVIKDVLMPTRTNNNVCKCTETKSSKSKKIWETVTYLIIALSISAGCIYLFTSPSKINYSVGIVALSCLVVYSIHYILIMTNN